jgi:hypothetical protein
VECGLTILNHGGHADYDPCIRQHEGNHADVVYASVEPRPSWSSDQPPLKCVLQALGQLVGQRVFNRVA